MPMQYKKIVMDDSLSQKAAQARRAFMVCVRNIRWARHTAC